MGNNIINSPALLKPENLGDESDIMSDPTNPGLKKHFIIPLLICINQDDFNINTVIEQVNRVLCRNGHYGIKSVKYQRAISKKIETDDGFKKDSRLLIVGDLITRDGSTPMLYRIEVSRIRKKIYVDCIDLN